MTPLDKLLARLRELEGRGDTRGCWEMAPVLLEIIEKQREALGYYAKPENWYFTGECRMVIGSIDTEDPKWTGGRGARLAIAECDAPAENLK